MMRALHTTHQDETRHPIFSKSTVDMAMLAEYQY